MFLSGTLLNVAAVLIGTTVGLLVGSRMPPRMQSTLTDALGIFTLLLGAALGLRIFSDPAARVGDELAILGSIQNGLTGDIQLLSVKSLLDGVVSVAFATALGAGVYLSALAVLAVQGGIATVAWLLASGFDDTSIWAVSAVGGLLLVGVGLRLLEVKQVRVVNLLPALVLAPLFVQLAAVVRGLIE
ncbi:MAG TPA: DUF554 family protein [Candidatus Limnocylindria bacterium]|nr:DUF554 family protein [Candidatus Limnocylindria bacterium]